MLGMLGDADRAYWVGAEQKLGGSPGEGANAIGAGVCKGLAQHLGQAHIRQLCLALLQQHICRFYILHHTQRCLLSTMLMKHCIL